MWMPPDLGRQYILEHERKLEEEARLREARTGRPSEVLRRRGSTMRMVVLGLITVAVTIILLAALAVLQSPAGE